MADVAEGVPIAQQIQRYFYTWRSGGTLPTVNRHLLMATRKATGREAGPSAAAPH